MLNCFKLYLLIKIIYLLTCYCYLPQGYCHNSVFSPNWLENGVRDQKCIKNQNWRGKMFDFKMGNQNRETYKLEN
jgi:hypothetical protein